MASPVIFRFLGDDTQLTRTLGTVGSRMDNVGRTLTRTLTPAALAAGAVFGKAFKDLDEGVDALRAGTGATGKALEGLERSMKRVGGRVTQSMGEVGQVMADLNTRTGLTGKSLEGLTKQFLDLNGRLRNQASVEAVTRVFGDWSVATDDQTAAMDKLFRASQATGPSIDAISRGLVQFGAPLRQLGFDLDTSAALLGKFEKEGVNTELVLGSMRIALGKMARSGEDAQTTFRRVVGEIENAGSASEANAKALELFGARAGPDMAAAIREGRFELGELLAQVSSGTETIEAAAKDTLDWSDRLQMLKNRVTGVIGPFGEMGLAVAGLAAGLGPAITLTSKLGGAATGLGGALTFLAANPVVLIIAAVAALAAGLVIAYQRSETFRNIVNAVFGAVAKAGKVMADLVVGALRFIREHLDLLLVVGLGPLGAAIVLLKNNWSTVWNVIQIVVSRAVDNVKFVLRPLIELMERVVSLADRVIGLAGKVGGVVGDVLGGAGKVLGKIPGFAGGVRNFAGGLAVVGERGPELVNLPPGSDVIPGPFGGIQIFVQGSDDPVQTARATALALRMVF